MPKGKILAAAEARFLQCVVFDSFGRKRSVSIYACGTDIFWGADIFDLMAHLNDRTQMDKWRAPKWLRDALSDLSGARLFTWDGKEVTASGAAQSKAEVEAPVETVPAGEPLGEISESAVPQGPRKGRKT